MQRNRQIWCPILLFAFASGITVAKIQLVAEDFKEIRVKDVLDLPGFAYVGVAGVCDITADRAVCWDTEGKQFESLSESIFAYYVSRYGTTISVDARKKNRWIVFETEEPLTESTWSLLNFQNGSYQGPLKGWRRGRSLKWTTVHVAKEDKAVSIPVSFTRELPVVEMPFKKGAVADLPKERIILSDFGVLEPPVDSDSFSFGPRQAQFRVVFKREPKLGTRGIARSPNVLNHKGKPIQDARTDGEPATASDSVMNSRSWVYFSEKGRNADQVEYITNINPRHIGKLVFRASLSRTVIFEDLPLDPLPR